ncbi:MAG: hypothetical protein QOD75_1586 [Blastocatellia bacterium]|jgi:hypothetical protein|nr:hypothetical protein [Blastocatellia bacterium]
MKSLAVGFLAFAPVPAAAQTCPCGQTLACYQTNNYRVGKIRIETLFAKNVPLDWIFKIQELLLNDFTQIKPELALKEGEKFTVGDYNSSHLKFGQLLDARNAGERFKLIYLTSSLQNCNPAALTIDVVYRVFTTDGLSFLTARSERRNDKVSRAVLIPIPGSGNRKLLPQPYVGFNATRGLFGGSKASFKTTGGIINQLEFDVSGSGSSATADVALIGSKEFDDGFINYTQWQVAYSYSNVPGDSIRLKEGILRGQIFGGSHPLGSRGLALRFGASIEGGHKQADLPANTITAAAGPADSRYGAIKAYVGGTMNWGRQAWRASYGLQLGQGGKDVRVDYIKHVVDTSYSARFLAREHKPLRLDVSGSAGLITSRSGLVPIGERFFGGNIQKSFIQGTDWEFNSSPVIRSFPQNSLNLIGPGLPIGGKSFFSINLTLAQTIWYRAAVPEELAREPDLKIKLGGAITTERENAKSSYLDLAPDFKGLVTDLEKLDTVLKELNATLDAVKSTPQPGPVMNAINAFVEKNPDTNIRLIPDALDAIAAAHADKKVVVDQAVTLAQDFPDLDIESSITTVVKTITNARDPFAAAGLPTSELDKQISPLQAIQQDMVTKIPLINDIGKYDANDIKFVADKVNELTPILAGIQLRLSQLPPPQDNDPVAVYASKLDAVSQYQKAAAGGVTQVNQDNVTVRGAERLAVGYGEVASAVLTGLINSIGEFQAPLQQKGFSAQAQALSDHATRVKALQNEIRVRLKKVRIPEIERKANRDVAYTGRVLDVIFREMNLVAISPVAMIDVARIGPLVSPTYDRLRYGLGGGLRLSLVSLDFDVGYSWNPRRLPGERHGAFVFALSVSDLFR